MQPVKKLWSNPNKLQNMLRWNMTTKKIKKKIIKKINTKEISIEAGNIWPDLVEPTKTWSEAIVTHQMWKFHWRAPCDRPVTCHPGADPWRDH